MDASRQCSIASPIPINVITHLEGPRVVVAAGCKGFNWAPCPTALRPATVKSATPRGPEQVNALLLILWFIFNNVLGFFRSCPESGDLFGRRT
jgi:hypothetical protein